MKKLTIEERVIRFLTQVCKADEVASRSRYRQLRKSECQSFYFVGKNGAVRTGKNASDSISITNPIHRQMEDWEASPQHPNYK